MHPDVVALIEEYTAGVVRSKRAYRQRPTRPKPCPMCRNGWHESCNESSRVTCQICPCSNAGHVDRAGGGDAP